MDAATILANTRDECSVFDRTISGSNFKKNTKRSVMELQRSIIHSIGRMSEIIRVTEVLDPKSTQQVFKLLRIIFHLTGRCFTSVVLTHPHGRRFESCLRNQKTTVFTMKTVVFLTFSVEMMRQKTWVNHLTHTLTHNGIDSSG